MWLILRAARQLFAFSRVQLLDVDGNICRVQMQNLTWTWAPRSVCVFPLYFFYREQHSDLRTSLPSGQSCRDNNK
jgi:hypothetical protein